MSLLVYTDEPTQHDHAVRKYTGAVATGYDAKRMGAPKWAAEDKIIKDMLADMPNDSYVLDIPTGTGRFMQHYVDRGFGVRAMDVSEDMLKEAGAKVPPSNQVKYSVGDVRELPSDLNMVDVSVS